MHSLSFFDDETSPFLAPPPEDFTGTAGKDKLKGTSGSDFFDMSQGGNDVVHAGGGDDHIAFGAAFTARDKIDGGKGFDHVSLDGDYSAGVVFRDKTMANVEFLDLFGTGFGGGDYRLTVTDGTAGTFLYVLLQGGGMDANTLWFDASAEQSADIAVQNSTRGANNIWTGGGNDSLFSGRLATGQTFDGGAGYDFLSFARAGFGITFSLLGQGHAQDLGGGHMVTVNGIEAFSGTGFADNLTGDDKDNYILSSGGDDIVHAGGGNDFVYIEDDVGPYTLVIADGGSGNDTLSFLFSAEGLKFSLALQGAAQTTGQGDGVVNAIGFENVEGTFFADRLTGDGADNTLVGYWDADTIDGGAGSDVLYGDASYFKNYTDIGQIGFDGSFSIVEDEEGFGDTLNGGAGKDKLIGGLGADMLTGGNGADKFIYESTADSGVGTGNRDIVTDFSHAQADKIDLHLIDADTTQAHDQAFHLGGASFTHSAGELIQFADGQGHTILAGDTNGDGQADFEIQLDHAPVLVAGDFVL